MDTEKISDILLVDDSLTVLEMLSDVLAVQGHRVRTAGDGREALAAIAQCPPDLVVLDVMMPEMDGYEVCETLRRQQDSGPYIPVLMFTAGGDITRGLMTGADDFITKPPNHKEFIARVGNLLRLGTLKRTLHEKNLELEEKNFLLRTQNQELEAMAEQLRAQNEQLEGMAGQLQAQNQQLESMALELREANGQLAHLSVTDELTQAHNHRHFQERLRSELARARRHATALSCLFIDIDRFKRVNDAHGHLAGDQVLIGLVKILRQSVRDEDLVARYGGEEFALLLPETTPESAHHLAERLRQKVEEARFPVAGGESLSITISVGVVDYSPDTPLPEPQDFVGAADRALFRAKGGGRNRVEVEPATWLSGESVLDCHTC